MRRLLFYLLPILFVILSIGFCGDYVIKMARLKNVQIGTVVGELPVMLLVLNTKIKQTGTIL